MKKRVLAIVLGLTMAAAMLAGCGSKKAEETALPEEAAAQEESAEKPKDTAATAEEAKSESRTIKILSMWPEDDAATTANGSIITAMCEQYKAEVDPDFTWEYEYVDSDNLKTKVQTLAASDDLPDIFPYDAGTPLVDLIEADLVLNITEALEASGTYGILDKGATTYLSALTGTEGIYDLPLGLNIEGFWYNKALFEQAGITAAPSTWEEMLAAANQLLAAGIQPFATGAGDSWPATRLIHAYAIRLMGKDCMQEAANGTVAYNSDGFVEAAQMIQDMNKKGYFGVGATTVDQNTAADMVLAGEAAMIYNGSWYTSSLNAGTNPAGPDGIGFFNIPTVEGGKGAATEYAMNCGTILCVNKKTYDETMTGFLNYFVSNVGEYSMSKFGALKGYVIDNYAGEMSNYTKLVSDEMGKVTGTANWFEALMNGELSTIAQENVQSLMNGDLSAKEYCDTMQEIYESTK